MSMVIEFLTSVLSVIALLFVLMGGWVMAQAAARRTAQQHPEAGPYQEAGSCGGGCGHCAQTCDHPPRADDAAATATGAIAPITVFHR
jgi:hypothetical protein